MHGNAGLTADLGPQLFQFCHDAMGSVYTGWCMAQTLSEIKALLKSHGLRPKHRLGQNFLHDGNQMRRIVEAAALEPGELVLEVGAGTGALSEYLLDAGARLVAIEMDGDLEPILRQRLASYGDRATLVIDDVLTGKHQINPRVIEPIQSAIYDLQSAMSTFKLVANLPYNVASPLIANLVCDYPQMSLAVVMIQREVAERLTASPGVKAYGPLGVLVQAMYHVEKIATLGPSCFWPPPKVESQVVRLRRRDAPLTDDPAKLSQTLQRLFQRRRKQLGSILGRARPLPGGIDPTWRPERLSVEQLIMLSDWLG